MITWNVFVWVPKPIRKQFIQSDELFLGRLIEGIEFSMIEFSILGTLKTKIQWFQLAMKCSLNHNRNDQKIFCGVYVIYAFTQNTKSSN